MAKEKQLKMSNNQDLNLIHENLYQKCNNDWIKVSLLMPNADHLLMFVTFAEYVGGILLSN